MSRFDVVLAHPEPTTDQETGVHYARGLQERMLDDGAVRRPDPTPSGRPVVLTDVRSPREGDHAGGRRREGGLGGGLSAGQRRRRNSIQAWDTDGGALSGGLATGSP